MLSYQHYVENFGTIFLGFGLFFAFVLFVLFYHGVFHKVEVKVTKPPFTKDVFVVYKFTQNYAASRYLLTEAQNLAPQLDSFSIYHEDFYTRKQVGSSVGVMISDKMEENLYKKLIHAGFKVAVFPNIDYAVVSSFPLKNQYSLAVAVYRIYPRLKQYIKANRLCAHPIMELYTKDTVYFIAPLSKQFDFYAEEALPVYDGSSSEFEDEPVIDEYECSKCHYHQNALIKQCCCDPLLHSSSCDRRKRAL
ncbi:testis-expressed protein 264 homolog [Argiope bruennichi]|uniref:testis-expressed protein 264 homolog n=1 Tax=Argiope bruennichi TaxID=94029 RepID=UPI002493DEBE|nr:testis-expressed protein 264 homolog [Argiope bruennichi]